MACFLFSRWASPWAAIVLLAAQNPIYGQVIVPDRGGASCEVGPKCEKYRYEFLPDPGQTFLHWQVRGDLRLLSPADQNPAVICSQGYGKGRITAHYYTFRKDDRCREKCPDTLFHTLDYDVFKRFEAPDPIHGPVCAAPNQEVTYWVPPVLTDYPHYSAGIGADSYRWSGFPGNSLVNVTGDSSAITLLLPAGTPAFMLECQVGRCNGTISLSVSVSTSQPMISGGPICLPVLPLTSFPLTIQAQANTRYTWLIPPGWQIVPAAAATVGLTLSSPGPMTVQVSPGRGSGDVVVTADAAGGCAPASSVPFHLSRRLVAGSNTLSDPGCLTLQQPATLTLSNAPTTEPLRWTVPPGWVVAGPAQPVSGMPDTYLTTGAALTLTPTTTSGGMVTITTAACPTVSISRSLTVSGPVPGCEFAIASDAGCAAFFATSGPGCPTSGTRYIEWRLYDTSISATAPVAVQTNVPPSASNTGIFANYSSPINPANLRVEVDVRNATCFAATYSATGTGQGITFVPCLQRPATSAVSTTQLWAYPNPAGGVLHVELTGLKARETAQLTLLDLTGRVVLTATTEKANSALSVSKLPIGTYTLRAELPGGKFISQVVQVQH